MKPKSKCVSKTKSKGENKIRSVNTSEYRDVPNRAARVTPKPAPLIQESLKESPPASKRKVYCNRC
jgi:hypothetical protein